MQYTSYNFQAVGKIPHYNVITNDWKFSNATPSVEFSAAEYDPVSKKIVMLGLDGLVIYDPATQVKTTAIDLRAETRIRNEQGGLVSGGELGINSRLVYFPPNQKMYYFDRGKKRVYEVTLDRSDFRKSQIVQLTTTGTVSPHYQPSYAYDAVNKIIGGGIYANKFYAFDPVTKTWHVEDIQGGNVGHQAYQALEYDDVNNVYILITEARQTWAYRYKRPAQ
jgi:hypothetical protein